MVLDSGATSHFVRQSDNLPATGRSDKLVTLPNGQTIKASHTVTLPFTALHTACRTAHVLPNLTTNSLVSVPKLADAGYTTIFHPGNKGVTIHEGGNRSTAVLQGWRDDTGLWRLDGDKTSMRGRVSETTTNTSATDTASNVYSLPSTAQAIRFLHAAAGFPTKATWLKAIANGHYQSWPGLTSQAVRRHFPDDALETQKGHMAKQRQNVRSTKQAIILDDDDNEPLTHSFAKHKLMVKVVNATRTIYTDQTGHFPVQSSQGN